MNKLFQEFIDIVTTAPETAVFVSSFEERDGNLLYLFDGYMHSAIVYKDGRYYDVQDTHHDRIADEDLLKYNYFYFPAEIADRMINDFA